MPSGVLGLACGLPLVQYITQKCERRQDESKRGEEGAVVGKTGDIEKPTPKSGILTAFYAIKMRVFPRFVLNVNLASPKLSLISLFQ